MIKINLVPQKVSPNVARGKQWLGLFLLAIGLTAAGCYYHYNSMVDLSSIEENKKKAASLARQKKDLFKQIGKIKVIPAEKKKKIQERYKKKLKMVTRIENVRSNPVFALLELSRILSIGQMPTVVSSLNQTKINLDPNWVPTPIYLTSLKENNREVSIKGVTMSYSDVSEFAKRLNYSAYFRNPEIVETKKIKEKKKTKDNDIEITKVDFSLRAIMVY
ncbi:MAG: PilN domain-containing protein [Deltaproteobacteria bacterium]|jgi:Tfp pilus assembly protein PilN|nr:PilN domain-containing protein [Deltaproteobacteria bacterium]